MRRCRLILLCAVTSLCSAAPAEIKPLSTVVIHDSGNTTPVSVYLTDDQLSHYRFVDQQPPTQDDIQAAIQEVLTKYAPSTESKDILDRLFPITTTLIQPLRLVSKYQPADISYLKSPIFIIGADQYSVDWLRVNKNELIRLGSIGVVAAADSLATFHQLQQLSAPLEILPTGADAIAEQFKVPGYPVLLTENGFYQ